MVVREPGIGNTALCEQVAAYVLLRGGRALVSHCYPQGGADEGVLWELELLPDDVDDICDLLRERIKELTPVSGYPFFGAA